MPAYKAPVKETLFLLNDVFNIEQYRSLRGFEDLSPDLLSAIFEEAGKLAGEVLQPINLSGDQQGCKRLPDGSITTPDGFIAAYNTLKDGGWVGLSADEAHGGQGLPATLTILINEYFASANLAFGMYAGLSQGAYAALNVHASDDVKSKFMEKLASGEWTGTMNLTEPHCGTDLGLLRTKAVRADDGSYNISGTKIFISAGDHDLAENIVHLVLARIEGAPEGTKGVSLFVVPKRKVDADGNAAETNGVTCGSLEEKMGIHGNATCVMNFDDANGWLIGEENRGLKAMFVMMNEARMGVAVQGLSVSEAAYQNAVTYARDRLQGRSLTGPKFPDKIADPIIVHPDIRRTLMSIRSFNEAARALIVWTALKSDEAHRTPDSDARQKASDHLSLLTPVLKGVLTDRGFDNTVAAQQVYGGHGYISEWGMEQFVRDARIPMIYEGANGIQALDLVGRKLPADGGRALQAFLGEIGMFIQAHATDEDMQPFVLPLKTAAEDLQAATMWFMQNALGNPDHAGAGSTDYMHMFGLVSLGYMWARMAHVCLQQKSEGKGDVAFHDDKLLLGTFFAERHLPETAFRRVRVENGSESMMKMAADRF
ncbi:MAG: acyl-CoA dehydrogenase C-terminal domain-containing protein [Cohaesibacteraceae bacterium]|nr:acyl-CoA dehydrogenase C-terminal domain-containing protein [Cohaesibacteraceae bacterium]